MNKQHEKNVFQGIEIVKQEEKDSAGWIPIVYGMDESNTPPEGKCILLSFSNFSLPAVGRYEDGSFFLGGEDEPLTQYDVYVNAWQPLPECYKENES